MKKQKSNKEELVPNSKKIIYQENTYIPLGKCEKLSEERQKRKTQKEEQMPARNVNEATLSDELNN